MRTTPAAKALTATGFTLVELMVVIVIVAILMMIAVPSYMSQQRQARRTEAKTFLLDLASREERYMSTNGVYTAAANSLGYAGVFPQNTADNFYTISAPVVVAAVAPTQLAAGSPATFALTATAIGTQAKDTSCLVFTLTSAGVQGATSATCW
jgi:type IV pilus assembly protein PilE